jgi:hypothetical protein
MIHQNLTEVYREIRNKNLTLLLARFQEYVSHQHENQIDNHWLIVGKERQNQ